MSERFERYLEAERGARVRADECAADEDGLIRVADDAYKSLESPPPAARRVVNLPRPQRVFPSIDSFALDVKAEPEPARPFGDYIAWLHRGLHPRVEEFGAGSSRLRLADARRGGSGARAKKGTASCGRSSGVPLGDPARLRAAAPPDVNTVVQGAWASFARHASGGATWPSGPPPLGRPAELPGVETMVACSQRPADGASGCRGRAARRLAQADSGDAIRGAAVRVQPFVQVAAPDDVPRGVPLSSILSFENYPIDDSIQDTSKPPAQRSGQRQPHQLPATVIVAPRAQMVLRLVYDRRRSTARRRKPRRAVRGLFCATSPSAPTRPSSISSGACKRRRGRRLAVQKRPRSPSARASSRSSRRW